MWKVSEILDNHNFDILATQCAPSGHNHATWHIIGVALDKKKEADDALKKSITIFDPEVSAYEEQNESFREKLTEIFSVPLMKYSKELEGMIVDVDKKESVEEKKFLHKRFMEKNTLLYNNLERYFRLDEEELLNRINEHELYRPVESRWLQQMAVFRSYSQASQKNGAQRHFASWNNPIFFKYDARLSILEPFDSENKRRYLQIINTCMKVDDLPVKAIAAFNHEEHYLRIVLPQSADRKKRVSINLDYTAIFDDPTNADLSEYSNVSSKGLLKEISGILRDCKVSMNYISNNTTLRTKSKEEGSFSLIGTPTQEFEKENFKDLEFKLRHIDQIKSNISFSKISVSDVGAKRLFISTKFDYTHGPNGLRPELEPELIRLSKKHGFEPVWGNPQDDIDPSKKELHALPLEIIDRVTTSHAFLQVIPKETKDQSWLLFELGLALGASLKYAICVHDENISDYPSKVAEGIIKYPFNSTGSDAHICKEFERAIIGLNKRVYDWEK